MLGLLALYSELHPTISYIVHYGIDMLAPVYKLQVEEQAVKYFVITAKRCKVEIVIK